MNGHWLDLLGKTATAVTRPTVTIIFAAVVAQVVIEGINAPWQFWSLAVGCILWWFGDRTLKHIKERNNGL